MPKNRSKASKKQSSSQPTKELASICSEHISKEDSFENAKEWVRSGKYNTKLFAKHLPNTATSIIAQGQNFEMVSHSLERIYVWLTNRDDTVRLRHLSCVFVDVILPESAPLTIRAFCLAQVGRIICHPEDPQGAVAGIQSSLPESIKGVKNFFGTERGIASMTQALGGNFVRESPVFRTEAELLKAVVAKMGDVDTEELRRECEEVRRISKEFMRITVHFHSSFHKCWQCYKVVENIMHCGGCKAAAYCSRNCQVAAWKGGHKGKCDRLKMMHKLHLTAVEEMENAHLIGVVDGLKLCPWPDFKVLNHCMGCTALEIGPDPSSRSMKNFYENLGRIVRREWWVYDMSNATVCTNCAADETDLFEILGCLTMDWFGSNEDRQLMSACIDSFFRKSCGPPVAAEVLLKFYTSLGSEKSGNMIFTLSSYEFLRTVYDKIH